MARTIKTRLERAIVDVCRNEGCTDGCSDTVMCYFAEQYVNAATSAVIEMIGPVQPLIPNGSQG